jgi:hypothetical protein
MIKRGLIALATVPRALIGPRQAIERMFYSLKFLGQRTMASWSNAVRGFPSPVDKFFHTFYYQSCCPLYKERL